MWQEIVLGPVFKIIDKLIPDKLEAERLKQETIRLNQQGEFKAEENRYNAIVTEASSTDPWTSRARPSFMYVFYFILLFLTVVCPFIGLYSPDAMAAVYTSVKAGFAALPEELWWTFTAGYLGYTTSRYYEKKNSLAR
jgi:hypothetical protein